MIPEPSDGIIWWSFVVICVAIDVGLAMMFYWWALDRFKGLYIEIELRPPRCRLVRLEEEQKQ